MTRTLEMWTSFTDHTGRRNIADYLIVGDMVTEDLITHIRNHMTLETDKPKYLQLEDVQGYSYDLARALKPIYPTFTAYGSQWRFHGACFKWETINRF